MTRVLTALTVLLVHTGAALAQQVPQPFPGEGGPLAWGPGTPPPPSAKAADQTNAQTNAQSDAGSAPPSQPPPPPPANPPPPAARAQPLGPPPPPSSEDYPPGYGPPPGYTPPMHYGPPPPYGPGPGYGPPPGYYPRPYYHYRYSMRPTPPPRRVTDRPFTIGGGLGFGGLRNVDGAGNVNTDTGLAYTAHLGFGLRPGLILMWDIEGATANRGAHSFSQTAQLVALQIFIGDRLFIKGGFGLAQANRDDLNYSNWGGAVMGGLGIELIQGWNWSLDVQTTATGAFYDQTTQMNWSLVNFGLNFF
jgi:hypothetical protein